MVKGLRGLAFLASWSCLAVSAQDRVVDNPLRDRTTVTGGGATDLVVKVDGLSLFEGPGTRGVVEVVENAKFPGKRFVTVRVDGEERVRLPATSLDPPLRVPDPRIGYAEKLALERESEGDAMTLRIVATQGDKETKVDVYQGPLAERELSGRGDMVEVLVGGACVFRVRRVRPAAPKVPGVVAGDFAARINGFRKAAGVREVVVKAAMNRACDLHASYLARNRDVANVHTEEPGRPGYTEEGARVAKVSVIQQFGSRRDLRESIDSLISVIYHRQPLLAPGLKEIGAGWAWDAEGRGVVVIDVSGVGEVQAEPVVYPGPGSKNVPLEFALGGREVPDPLPDPRVAAGYPVTVQFDGTGWRPLGARAKLLLDGTEVPAWVSGPDKPARADRPQPDLVAVIPKERLKPGTTYAVEVTCTREGGAEWSRKWEFTTAK